MTTWHGFGKRLLPTFFVRGVPAAMTNDDYAIVILNRNTEKAVRIWRANLMLSTITSAAAGVLTQFRLGRTSTSSGLTGGTDATIVQADTQDVFPTNIDAKMLPTGPVFTDETIRLAFMSQDEPGVSTLDADFYSSAVFGRENNAILQFSVPGPLKPLTLRSDGVTHEGFFIQRGSLSGGAAPANLLVEVLTTVSDD